MQQTQLSSIDTLDTKASGMLGFAGLVLTILFSSETVRTHWTWALTAGVAALGASVGPLVAALWPRTYRYNPNLVAYVDGFMTADPEEANRLAAESIAQGYVENQNTISAKAGWMTWGMVLLGVGVAFTSAGLIYSVT